MTHPYIVDTTPDENGVGYSNVQNKKDKQNDYCDDEIVPHTEIFDLNVGTIFKTA